MAPPPPQYPAAVPVWAGRARSQCFGRRFATITILSPIIPLPTMEGMGLSSAPGRGCVMHHTKRVKAARSEFCPQMSSSGHGCVHKNQDSSSQPCPDGTGKIELPVDHRSEIPAELSITSFWPNLYLFQKTARPSLPSAGWGMQRFVQQFITQSSIIQHP